MGQLETQPQAATSTSKIALLEQKWPLPRYGVRIPYGDFTMMRPAPGHRNSQERALKVRHLNALGDDQLQVDLVEVSGEKMRLTGNTRAAKWANEPSLAPEYVIATIFTRNTVEEAAELMTHFDSPEAAWRMRDWNFRAYNLTYGETWHPRTSVARDRLSRPLRMAEAINQGYSSPDPNLKVEQVMKNWKAEIIELDHAIDTPFGEGLEDINPYRSGILTGWLILLRYNDMKVVTSFVREALGNLGIKDESGMDGIMMMTELFARDQRRGRSSRATEMEYVRKTIGAFEVFQKQGRSKALNVRPDPMRYCATKREEQEKAAQREAKAAE